MIVESVRHAIPDEAPRASSHCQHCDVLSGTTHRAAAPGAGATA